MRSRARPSCRHPSPQPQHVHQPAHDAVAWSYLRRGFPYLSPIARHILMRRITCSAQVRTLGSALLLAGVGGLSDQHTAIRFTRRRECAGFANERQPDPTVSLPKAGTGQYGVPVLPIPDAGDVAGTTSRREGGRILPGHRTAARAGRHLPPAFFTHRRFLQGQYPQRPTRDNTQVAVSCPPALQRPELLGPPVVCHDHLLGDAGLPAGHYLPKVVQVRCRGFCRSSPSTGSL